LKFILKTVAASILVSIGTGLVILVTSIINDISLAKAHSAVITKLHSRVNNLELNEKQRTQLLLDIKDDVSLIKTYLINRRK